MNRTRIIRKLLTALFWLFAGSGMVTLLVAANRRDAGHVVREVQITILGDGEHFFIDKSDILLQITVAAKTALVGRSLDGLNLARLERSLERGVWIRDAELWIDSRDVLHVKVTEREPVARIFTTAGASFYIDSSGQRMPLLEKESARVLVVSNYPGAVHFNHQDSARAADVKAIANRIWADEFWKEQIAQIDITPSGSFEAVPVVGNHLIRLGDAAHLDAKLARLMTFYKKVLARTGFDRYAVVDVQYDGQVVGVQRGTVSTVDSLQLQKNIEDLLARSQAQLLHDSLNAVEQLSASADTQRVRRILPLDSIANVAEPFGPVAAPAERPKPDTARRTISTPRATMPAVQRPKPAAVQPARQQAATTRTVIRPATARATIARTTAKPAAPKPAAQQRAAGQRPPKRAQRRATTNEY
jgi:cell division protein FtsQ